MSAERVVWRRFLRLICLTCPSPPPCPPLPPPPVPEKSPMDLTRFWIDEVVIYLPNPASDHVQHSADLGHDATILNHCVPLPPHEYTFLPQCPVWRTQQKIQVLPASPELMFENGTVRTNSTFDWNRTADADATLEYNGTTQSTVSFNRLNQSLSLPIWSVVLSLLLVVVVLTTACYIKPCRSLSNGSGDDDGDHDSDNKPKSKAGKSTSAGDGRFQDPARDGSGSSHTSTDQGCAGAVAETEESGASLLRTIEESRREATSLRAQLDTTEQENAHLRSRFGIAEGHLRDAIRAARRSDENSDYLSSEIFKLEGEVRTLTRERDTAMDQSTVLKDKVKSQQADLEAIQKKLHQAAEEKEKLDGSVSTATAAQSLLATENTQLEAIAAERKKVLDERDVTISRLTEQMKTLSREHASLVSSEAKRKLDISSLQLEKVGLNRQIEASKAKVNESKILKAQVDSQQRTIESLRQDVDKCSRERDQMSAAIREKDTLIAQCDSEKIRQETLITAHEKTIREVWQKLTAKEKAQKELAAITKTKDLVIKQLRADKAALALEVNEQKSTITALGIAQGELEDEKETLSQENRRCSLILKGKDVGSDTVAAENDDLTQLVQRQTATLLERDVTIEILERNAHRHLVEVFEKDSQIKHLTQQVRRLTSGQGETKQVGDETSDHRESTQTKSRAEISVEPEIPVNDLRSEVSPLADSSAAGSALAGPSDRPFKGTAEEWRRQKLDPVKQVQDEEARIQKAREYLTTGGTGMQNASHCPSQGQGPLSKANKQKRSQPESHGKPTTPPTALSNTDDVALSSPHIQTMIIDAVAEDVVGRPNDATSKSSLPKASGQTEPKPANERGGPHGLEETEVGEQAVSEPKGQKVVAAGPGDLAKSSWADEMMAEDEANQQKPTKEPVQDRQASEKPLSPAKGRFFHEPKIKKGSATGLGDLAKSIWADVPGLEVETFSADIVSQHGQGSAVRPSRTRGHIFTTTNNQKGTATDTDDLLKSRWAPALPDDDHRPTATAKANPSRKMETETHQTRQGQRKDNQGLEDIASSMWATGLNSDGPPPHPTRDDKPKAKEKPKGKPKGKDTAKAKEQIVTQTDVKKSSTDGLGDLAASMWASDSVSSALPSEPAQKDSFFTVPKTKKGSAVGPGDLAKSMWATDSPTDESPSQSIKVDQISTVPKVKKENADGPEDLTKSMWATDTIETVPAAPPKPQEQGMDHVSSIPKAKKGAEEGSGDLAKSIWAEESALSAPPSQPAPKEPFFTTHKVKKGTAEGPGDLAKSMWAPGSTETPPVAQPSQDTFFTTPKVKKGTAEGLGDLAKSMWAPESRETAPAAQPVQDGAAKSPTIMTPNIKKVTANDAGDLAMSMWAPDATKATPVTQSEKGPSTEGSGFQMTPPELSTATISDQEAPASLRWGTGESGMTLSVQSIEEEPPMDFVYSKPRVQIGPTHGSIDMTDSQRSTESLEAGVPLKQTPVDVTMSDVGHAPNHEPGDLESSTRATDRGDTFLVVQSTDEEPPMDYVFSRPRVQIGPVSVTNTLADSRWATEQLETAAQTQPTDDEPTTDATFTMRTVSDAQTSTTDASRHQTPPNAPTGPRAQGREVPGAPIGPRRGSYRGRARGPSVLGRYAAANGRGNGINKRRS